MKTETIVGAHNQQRAKELSNFDITRDEHELYTATLDTVTSIFDGLVTQRRQVGPLGFPLDSNHYTYEAVSMGEHEVEGTMRPIYVQPSKRVRLVDDNIKVEDEYELYVVIPDRKCNPRTMSEHFHYLNSRFIGRLEIDVLAAVTKNSLANLLEFAELLTEVSIRAGSQVADIDAGSA